MLRRYFENIIIEALKKSEFASLIDFNELKLNCEIPKNRDFGDFAINVSSMAKILKIAPPLIAQKIVENIDCKDFQTTIAGGFLNFKVESNILNSIIKEIIKKSEKYGSTNLGCGEKVLIEECEDKRRGKIRKITQKEFEINWLFKARIQ